MGIFFWEVFENFFRSLSSFVIMLHLALPIFPEHSQYQVFSFLPHLLSFIIFLFFSIMIHSRVIFLHFYFLIFSFCWFEHFRRWQISFSETPCFQIESFFQILRFNFYAFWHNFYQQSNKIAFNLAFYLLSWSCLKSNLAFLLFFCFKFLVYLHILLWRLCMTLH